MLRMRKVVSMTLFACVPSGASQLATAWLANAHDESP